MRRLHSLLKWIATLPLLIGAIGVVVSAGVAYRVHAGIESNARAEFDLAADRVRDEISRRFATPLHGLRGALALHAVNPQWRRGDFRTYVGARLLPLEFPGVRGLGFIERVPKTAGAAFVAAERADDAPDFDIHELDPWSHEDRYVIRFVEPAQRNEAALGLDVGSDAHRRAAIDSAIDSGRPTLTAPVVLRQDASRSPGFLLVLPVYRQGADPVSVDDRRAAFAGVLFAPIVAAELLGDVRVALAGRVDFELRAAGGEFVYGERGEWARRARFEVVRPIDIYDNAFGVRVGSTPAFEATIDDTTARVTLAGGLLLTALLVYLALLTATGRARAEAMAQRMTVDLDRLAMVARRTSNAVVIADATRRVTWVNAGFERISGYALAEVIGRSPGQLLRCDETDRAELARLRAALDQGIAFDGELLNRHKDGRLYWIRIEIQPLRNGAGALTGFMAIESDVTDAKRAAQELARERARLALIVEGTGAGTWELDLASGRTTINGHYAAMLGHDVDALRSRLQGSFLERVHADDRAAVERLRQRHLDGEAAQYEAEFRMQHADGRWLWILSRGRVGSRDGAGRPLTMAGIHLDVTERHELEAELLRGHEMLTSIIENLPCGLSVFDAELAMLASNNKYRTLLGLPDGLFDGARLRFEDVYRYNAEHGANGEIDAELLVALASERRRSPQAAHRFEHVQDNGSALEVSSVPMPGGGVVTTYTDISERKRAEAEVRRSSEAAQEASRAKSRFLANMSHEIRTPMNAILGMLTLLRRTELSARQADYADKTEGAARSLLLLLNDILDHSKAEAGRMTLDPQPLRLRRLLHDVEVILLGNVGAKDVSLRLDVDDALPPVLLGDALRLQQVLVNLGGNAVKFTERGEVVVGVRVCARDDEAVRLAVSVRDTGIGIAAHNLQRIFTGFTQAEASTTRRFGGTGLGVAITQRLVALMGGELRVDSALGRGSCFSFEIELPLAPAGDAPETELAPLAAPTDRRLAGLRVLVAEDNVLNQQVARELLAAEGADVQIAGDGRLAVDAVARAEPPFDIVLMDLQMPQMDGYTATRRIRHDLGLHALPIVAMTANALASDREACLAAGMNDHVGKPFDLEHLVGVIRRATGLGEVEAVPAMPVATPALQDIDVTAALARLGGRRPTYRRLLRHFVDDLPRLQATLRACVDDARWSDAAHELHALKGVAATLGAPALAAHAAAAEQAFAGLPGASDARRALDAVIAAIDDAQPRLIAAGTTFVDAAAPAARADGAPLGAALRGLEQLLAASDMAALDHLERLRDTHGSALGAHFEALDAAVGDLDFERALQLCRALHEELTA